MAMHKFIINKDVSTSDAFIRTVEAATYRIQDGYFHFYSEDASFDGAVFSMKAEQVAVVEVLTD